jgi:hypothetical protein
VSANAGIEDILVNQPLAIESGHGFIRFRCSEPQYGVRIYDLAGKTIATLPEIHDYMEYSLPTGLYFISTSHHRLPIKTIVR